MSLTEAILAMVMLLLAPGPTNTLLATSASHMGFQRAIRLIPFEVTAYLLVTVPLVLFGNALSGYPWVFLSLKGVAACWIAYLAVMLWNGYDHGEDQPPVSAHRLFVTTLTNPKALVFGLVVLPGPDWGLRVLAFVGVISVIAMIWAGLGSRIPDRFKALSFKAAAVWLGLTSTYLTCMTVADAVALGA